MEPSINQPHYGNQPGFEGGKVYGRSKLRLGCIGIIGAVILLVLVVVIGIFFVYPAVTPDKLRGDFMKMEIVPLKDGGYRLWILTDGSFNFIKSTKSPGRQSTGRDCIFCKTWTYIYDPVSEKVHNKIKTEFNSVILTSDIVYNGGRVWVMHPPYSENEPRIFVYDSETGRQVMDTKDFTVKFPELQSGIVNLRLEKDNNLISFETRDGRTDLLYSIKEDRLYNSRKEYRNAAEKDSKRIISVYALGSDDSSPRKKLYKVTGPEEKIAGNEISESYPGNPRTLSSFLNSTSEQLTPEKIYIEGMIYYQDTECCLIVYQDQAGNMAGRMLSCVDANGKLKWTVPPGELFDKMKVDINKDPFSSMFFMKDKISLTRRADIVVLQLEYAGAMGFDFGTGEKKWELDF